MRLPGKKQTIGAFIANKFVVDSSAPIAVIKRERGWQEVAPLLLGCAMSVVNATEVGDALSRLDEDTGQMPAILREFGINIVPADLGLALMASDIFASTRTAGLSLGGRFCLALAKQRDVPALTGDRRWLDVADKIGVRVELFR